MSLSEERFREQLVDYLYGELDDARRAAFEAELSASPERRAELAALRATLQSARTGLSVLNEDPPVRLRGAILDAAQEQRKVQARAPWYRRGTTLAPLLAAAAALTFAVLSPNRDQQPGPDYSSEAAPASAPAQPAEQAPAPIAGDRLAAPPEAEGKGKLEAPRRAKKRDTGRRSEVELSAPREAAEPALRERDDAYAQPPEGWSGLGAASTAGGGPGASADKAERAQDEARSGAPAAPPASRPAPAKRAPDAAVESANAHMQAHRWSEAVLAYRELMQRYPKDERYVAWRGQLTRAANNLSAVQQVP